MPNNKGWICPSCTRIVAPHMNGCPSCNKKITEDNAQPKPQFIQD